jgi:hypothetical protein
LRATVRINRDRLIHELHTETRERRITITAAREAAFLPDFKHALRAGKLVVCCNCAHFTFNEDPGAMGRCEKFNDECAPFAPFWCAGFVQAAEPVASKYLPGGS